jgi:hypothetical protein
MNLAPTDTFCRLECLTNITFTQKDTARKVALEFDCGPGRNIVRFSDRFKQIDGVDISDINLKNAVIWCHHNGIVKMPALFKIDGVDIAVVAEDAYDVVFSTICLQQIPVYDLRFCF